MTKINCHITEAIQKDFSSLWKCKHRGNTVEISTPYLLPDSTLFTLFITEQKKKIIIHDGGSISQIVSEYCPFPDDEIKFSLDGFAAQHEIKQTIGAEKEKIFYRVCEKKKLISSAAFDLASFAMTATNALVAASYEEPDVKQDDRFQRSADSFIKAALPVGLKYKPRHEIKEVPGVKFSGVIERSNKIWIVSYITGSDLHRFKGSIAVTIMNFGHVWDCSLAKNNGVGATIPIVNTEASGYQPRKLGWQTDMLKASAHGAYLPWSGRNDFAELLNKSTSL